MVTLICILALILVFPVFFNFKLKVENAENDGVYLRLSVIGLTLYRSILKLKFKNSICPEIYETRKGKTRLVLSAEDFINKEKARERKAKQKGEKSKNVFKRAALKVFIIQSLTLKLSVGTGDAAASTLLCGALQAALDTAAHVYWTHIRQAYVSILPEFEKNGVEFFLYCIIRFRMADIIREVLLRKGGGSYAPNRKHTQSDNVRA